jgi:hypothetical protein
MSRLVRERAIEIAASDGRLLNIRVVDVAGARHLRLSLGRDGPRLSKPRWVSMRDAIAFANEKSDWLEAQLAERERETCLVDWPSALRPGARGSLPLRGAALTLHVETGRRPALTFDDDGLRLDLPDREDTALRRITAGLLRNWLETQMRHDLAPHLAGYTARLGRAPTRLSIRVLHSLWGSLSTRDHLSLDLSLILGPPAALEYVLVHELAHLFERNHGPRFWSTVAALLPDYRERQQTLRAQGAAIKSALRRMLAIAA